MNHSVVFSALLATAGLFVAGCKGPDPSAPVEPAQADLESAPAANAAPGEPVELTWDELMPQGEEQRLEDLYTAYYDELEQKMANAAEAQENGDDSGAQDLVAAIVEGSANDTMEQIGTFNVVSELNGKAIRLPGYVVPFDFSADAKYREFLLVPYFGACLHTPPPPPNQIVFVKADPAATIADIYDPVWVEGTLKTGEFNSELADSAYELTLSKVETYDY